MHVTLYTDYSLRVLIYLAEKKGLATIDELSEFYGISRNHLVRVVHDLGKLGILNNIRGRSGGVQLAKEPDKINVGEVVKATEEFKLLECFTPSTSTCPLTAQCTLKHVFMKANKNFIDTLLAYTVADLVKKPAPTSGKGTKK